MSSRRAAAKRKRSTKKDEESVEEVPTSSEVSTEVEYTLFSGWLDDGYPSDDVDVTEHEGFSLTFGGGRHFDISLGDAVLMRSGDDDDSEGTPAEYQDPSSKESSKAGAKGMLARVERIWEKKVPAGSEECPFMFQARWFLRVSIMGVNIDSLECNAVLTQSFSVVCTTERGS